MTDTNEAMGLERAWRDGFQTARDCLPDDAAFELTDDVEQDAWADSETATLASHPSPAIGAELEKVWTQARENHANYSATGSIEDDIRFFGLGLAGEAGEVANFIKKRWRDGDGHDDDLRKECADVFAYNIMLADALGMSASDLLAMVAHKQQVFIDKMEARAALTQENPDVQSD